MNVHPAKTLWQSHRTKVPIFDCDDSDVPLGGAVIRGGWQKSSVVHKSGGNYFMSEIAYANQHCLGEQITVWVRVPTPPAINKIPDGKEEPDPPCGGSPPDG